MDDFSTMISTWLSVGTGGSDFGLEIFFLTVFIIYLKLFCVLNSSRGTGINHEKRSCSSCLSFGTHVPVGLFQVHMIHINQCIFPQVLLFRSLLVFRLGPRSFLGPHNDVSFVDPIVPGTSWFSIRIFRHFFDQK